jgi:hypothetical protein
MTRWQGAVLCMLVALILKIFNDFNVTEWECLLIWISNYLLWEELRKQNAFN